MAMVPPICDFGWRAPDFTLPDIDGRDWSYEDIAGRNGALVMFICNHCPYVKAIVDRIARDAAQLKKMGIGVAAICSNDAHIYPEDSFERMKDFATQSSFGFPYLHDESQQTARAYAAVCTPDFFGFDRDKGLQYRGRLDASGRMPAAPDVRRDLVEAMHAMVETGRGPSDQIASMGCSIKWKAG